MSVSTNSAVDLKKPANESEAAADLSLNLDEAIDLQLGFGAIGGLRHSAACDAAERSQRRYDERNHRLHEARMRRLGLEGDEPEAEDMAQQVLIRSPVTHNHYHEPKQETPSQPQPVQQPTPQPTPPQPSAWSKTWPWLLAAATGLGGAGVAASVGGDKPATEPAKIEMPRYDVEHWKPE